MTGIPFTRRDVVMIVDGAVRAGRVHPRNRDTWLLKVAAGGRAAGDAVSDLMQMVPADPATRAAWQVHASGAQAPAEPSDDDIFDRLYPSDEAIARSRPGPEVDHLAAVDQRLGWLNSQAAASDGGAEPVPGHGHGPVSVEHEHPHSDYGTPPGQHSHPHVHRNDGVHEPGAGHGHGPAVGDPVAEGIAAKAAARTRAGDLAAADSDDALFTRLFGR